MRNVLIHIKIQKGPKEITEDIQSTTGKMLSDIEKSIRSHGAHGSFNRIMVFIYPGEPQENAK